jgi:AcrR family transcriptional regulator
MSTDRRYELKARAQRQRETGERIVAATEALHREVGPARTTIAEIARRAGVERLTVYNHFPDLTALLAACQTRFLAANPPPAIGPPKPLELALVELYGWFRANRAMERNVHRDRRLVPELDELMRRHADPHFQDAARLYAKALGRTPEGVEAVERLVRVALDFNTWDVLAGAGAGDSEAAYLFRKTVDCLRG